MAGTCTRVGIESVEDRQVGEVARRRGDRASARVVRYALEWVDCPVAPSGTVFSVVLGDALDKRQLANTGRMVRCQGPRRFLTSIPTRASTSQRSGRFPHAALPTPRFFAVQSRTGLLVLHRDGRNPGTRACSARAHVGR